MQDALDLLFHRPLTAATAEARKRELIYNLKEYRILVLKDTESPESAVSHSAATNVAQTLAALGLQAETLAGQELPLRVPAGPVVIFNLMYGDAGEGGTVQGYAEWLGLPITSSSADVCPIALDKWRTKLVLQAVGISVAPSVVVNSEADLGRLVESCFPAVAKPLVQGSSVGIARFATEAEARSRLPCLIERYGAYLLEPFLPGREFSVAIIETSLGGPRAFPPLEIRTFDGGIADRERKYQSQALELLCPGPVDTEFATNLAETALAAYRALGCHPVARVDMRCDENGTPFVLEVNHFPGMTPTSWLPRAAREAGWDFELLSMEIAEAARLKARERRTLVADPAPCGAGLLLVTADDPDPVASAAVAHLDSCIPGLRVTSLSSIVRQGAGGETVIDLLYDPAVDTCRTRGALDFGGRLRIGPSLLTTALAADRLTQRRVAKSIGVMQPDFSSANDAGHWMAGDGTFVIKHRRSMQSEGVRVLGRDEWPELHCREQDDLSDYVLERYVPGDEIHVGLATGQNGAVAVLPFFRLSGRDTVWLFDREAKADIWSYGCCPSEIDPALASRLVSESLRLHECFDRPPLARVEWRVPGPEPVLIEYDHWPGLTKESILPRMIAAAGHDLAIYLRNLKQISPPLARYPVPGAVSAQ